MCWMAAIPVAMAAGSAALSSYTGAKAQKAQNEQIRKQNLQTVKQMNYEEANLALENQDAKETLRDDLTQNSMQQVRNMGTLRAAIGESGLEGNSMRRVAQVTNGDYLRQQQGLKDNYERDYSQIFGKRLGNAEGAKAQIENNQDVKGASGTSQVLGALLSMGAAYASTQGGKGTSDTKAPISAAKGTPTGHK